MQKAISIRLTLLFVVCNLFTFMATADNTMPAEDRKPIIIIGDNDDILPRPLTIPVEAWLMGDNVSVIALNGISVITLTITDEMGNLVDSCITSLFAGQSAVLSVAGCPTGNYRITIQLPDDTVLFGEFIL
ncbi:MAG: DUF3244 domain-containing protein [Mediterranea massiliensis]|nr:DUF3244 domain-containing protein [Mediterranea massiliensis]